MPTEISLALFHLSLLLFTVLQDDTSADFADLGRKLLGGFILGVIVAVALALIYVRQRDKKPPAHFISISSFQKSDETPKAGRD